MIKMVTSLVALCNYSLQYQSKTHHRYLFCLTQGNHSVVKTTNYFFGELNYKPKCVKILPNCTVSCAIYK